MEWTGACMSLRIPTENLACPVVPFVRMLKDEAPIPTRRPKTNPYFI